MRKSTFLSLVLIVFVASFAYSDIRLGKSEFNMDANQRHKYYLDLVEGDILELAEGPDAGRVYAETQVKLRVKWNYGGSSLIGKWWIRVKIGSSTVALWGIYPGRNPNSSRTTSWISIPANQKTDVTVEIFYEAFWEEAGKRYIRPDLYNDSTAPTPPAIQGFSTDNGSYVLESSVSQNLSSEIKILSTGSSDGSNSSRSGIKHYEAVLKRSDTGAIVDQGIKRIEGDDVVVDASRLTEFQAYSLFVNAEDRVGNKSSDSSLHFVFDNKSPTGLATSITDFEYDVGDGLIDGGARLSGKFAYTPGQSEILDSHIDRFRVYYRQGGGTWIAAQEIPRSGSWEFDFLVPNARGKQYEVVAVPVDGIAGTNVSWSSGPSTNLSKRVASVPPSLPRPLVDSNFRIEPLGADNAGSISTRYSISIPLSGSWEQIAGHLKDSQAYSVALNSLDNSVGASNLVWLSGPTISDRIISGEIGTKNGEAVSQALRSLSSISLAVNYPQGEPETISSPAIVPGQLAGQNINIPTMFHYKDEVVAEWRNTAIGSAVLVAAGVSENRVLSNGNGVLELRTRLVNTGVTSSSFAIPVSEGADIQDHEGDKISFELQRMNGSTVAFRSDKFSNTNSIFLNLDTDPRFLAFDINEFLRLSFGKASFSEVPAGTYQIRLIKYETTSDLMAAEVNDNYQFPDATEAIEFSVLVDKTAPGVSAAGMFASYPAGQAGQRKLNDQDSFTNSPSVMLQFTAEDYGGSGFKHLEVRNAGGASITYNLDQANGPITWSLQNLGSGHAERVVQYRALDGAGNTSAWQSLTTVLKKSIPSAVAFDSPENQYALVRATNTVNLIFERNEPTAGNQIIALPGGTLVSAINWAEARPFSSGQQTISVSYPYPQGISGGNQPYTVRVYLRDAAHNVSGPTDITLYTLPIVGSAAAPVQEKNSAATPRTNYQLHWEVVGGEAAEQFVRILSVENAAGTARPSLAGDLALTGGQVTRTFPISGGTSVAHGSVTWQVVAKNSLGDEVTGPSTTMPLVNLSPNPGIRHTEIDANEGWIQPTVSFSWNPLTDPEGDAVIPIFVLNPASASNRFEIPLPANAQSVTLVEIRNRILQDYPDLSASQVSYVENLLEDNVQFSWALRSMDHPYKGISDSTESIVYTIDGTAPRVSQALDQVLNMERRAQFSVLEAGSGLIQIGGTPSLRWSLARGSIQSAGIWTDTSVESSGSGFWDAVLPREWPGDSGFLESGTYTLRIDLQDRAGNVTTVSQQVLIDLDPPEIVSVTPLDPLGWVSRGDDVSVRIVSSEPSSGVARYQYSLVPTVSGFDPQTADWAFVNGTGPLITGLDVSAQRYLSVQGIADGSESYLVLRAVDESGNIGPFRVANPAQRLVIDRRAPKVSFAILDEGGQTLQYLSDLSDLDAYTAEYSHMLDPAFYDSLTKSYGIREFGDMTLPEVWQNSLANIAEIGEGSDGAWYEIVARLESPTGIVRTYPSGPFLLDGRQPFGLQSTGLSYTDVVPGERLKWSFDVLTDGSPVKMIRLRYRAPDGEYWDMSGVAGATWQQENGRSVGSLVFETLSHVDLSFLVPVSVKDGSYEAEVTVTDSVGHIVELENPGLDFAVNRHDKIVVNDQGPWQALDVSGAGVTKLRAAWEYFGADTLARWRYRVRVDGIPFGEWINGSLPGNSIEIEEADVPGLVFEVGKHYQIQVSATLAGGLELTGSGVGVRFDQVAPEFIPGSVQISEYLSSNVVLTSWQVHDEIDGSGLKEVRAQLRRLSVVEADGELLTVISSVSPFVSLSTTSAAMNLPVAFVADGLMDGDRLLVAVEALDAAGNKREVLSNPAVYGASAPPTPIVIDEGEYLNPSFYEGPDGDDADSDPDEREGDAFVASWAWSQADPYSPTSYAYAILLREEVATDIAEHRWTGQGASQTVTVEGHELLDKYADGDVLVLAVRAQNAAGLRSIGYSDGIMIDTTAPYLPSVSLKLHGGVSGYFGERTYLDPAVVHSVEIQAADAESNLELVSGTIGRIAENGVYESLGSIGSQEVKEASSVVNLPVSQSLYSSNGLLADGTIINYQGTVVNGAGTSASRLSGGIMIDTVQPVVVDLLGYFADGVLYYSWDIEKGVAPIERVRLKLFNTTGSPGSAVEDIILPSASSKFFAYELGPDAEDGLYRVELDVLSENGQSSDPGLSNLVAVDASAPEIDLASTSYPFFVDTELGMEVFLKAVDPQSGIGEYEYSVGTIDDPFAYQQQWTRYDQSQVVSTLINLETLGKGLPQHSEDLYVYWRAKNTTGLWGFVQQSPGIRVDNSPASMPAISTADYALFTDRVSQISIFSGDQESGVTGFRLLVLADTTDEIVLDTIGETVVYQADGSQLLLDLEGLQILGLDPVLLDDGYYRIAGQVRNGSGRWSQVALSNVFQVDLTPPTIAFTDAQDYPVENPLGQIIINKGPTQVPYVLNTGQSHNDVVSLEFLLILPDGTTESQTFTRMLPYLLQGDNASFSPSYVFDKDIPGTYIVQATVTDKAGRIWTTPRQLSKSIRVNAPPVFDYHGRMDTTPGKPLDFAVSGIRDVDGDNSAITAVIQYPDGSSESAVYSGPSTEEWLAMDPAERPSGVLSFQRVFYHSAGEEDLHPQESDYLVSLYLVDSKGRQSEPVTIEVNVHNTRSGPLYVDEYWKDYLYEGQLRRPFIADDILVPPGISLTIEDFTHVEVIANGDLSTKHTLQVQGSLDAGVGVRWAENLGSTELWDGIIIEGIGNLAANSIFRASRAVVLGSASTVELTGLSVHGGLTGLHVLKTSQLVQDVVLEDLREYGIKLELGVQILLLDSIFDKVRRTVYDPSGRIVSPIGLNAGADYPGIAPGSGGNIVVDGQ